MNDINQIIADFVSDNISPTKEERKEIRKRYEQLAELFEKDKLFQTGSYARFTSVTPVHDLDVIWVLPEETISDTLRKSRSYKISADEIDVKNILEDLARKVQENYDDMGEPVVVTPQEHSINIDFHEGNHDFTIDIVPAIPLANQGGEQHEFGENYFLVPEIINYSHAVRLQKAKSNDKIDWIKSDPKGYIEEAKKFAKINNSDRNTSFRKATRFVKSWKAKVKAHDERVKLKSFHIEQIILRYIKDDQEISIVEAISKFFTELESNIYDASIPDRADQNVFIDLYVEKLSDEERSLIISKSRSAMSVIEKVQKKNEKEIINMLSDLVKQEDSDIVDKSPHVKVKNNDTTRPWCSTNLN